MYMSNLVVLAASEIGTLHTALDSRQLAIAYEAVLQIRDAIGMRYHRWYVSENEAFVSIPARKK